MATAFCRRQKAGRNPYTGGWIEECEVTLSLHKSGEYVCTECEVMVWSYDQSAVPESRRTARNWTSVSSWRAAEHLAMHLALGHKVPLDSMVRLAMHAMRAGR